MASVNRYVAVGASGKLATSSDALTWTLRTSSFGTTAINDVYSNGTVFVAVGDLGKVATSSNGLTWGQLPAQLRRRYSGGLS